jgi:hypothetical protein
MSPAQVTCPNCGAPVKFGYDSIVQSVCAYCRSVLVRTDVDVRKIGEMSEYPQDASPIQIGTEGVYNNRGFHVVGRILYEYENGGWNEWHIIFNDGTSGWLSDAQLEYAISSYFKDPGQVPASHQIAVGREMRWTGERYFVTSITRAHYRGVEGELPFQYWDKEKCMFADLRSHTGRFATIDYSEEQPLVFIGEFVEFDEMKLKNLRRFEGWS